MSRREEKARLTAQFLELLKQVRNTNKASFNYIARTIDMDENRMKTIRNGRSSATASDIERLKDAFSDILLSEDEQMNLEDEVKRLKLQYKALQKQVQLLKAHNDNLTLSLSKVLEMTLEMSRDNKDKTSSSSSDLKEEIRIKQEKGEQLKAEIDSLLKQTDLDD